MRNTLQDIFTSAGFAVAGEADDGVRPINLFRELKPDLVTMDIVMPYKSGIDATRRSSARSRRGGDHVLRPGRESLVMGPSRRRPTSSSAFAERTSWPWWKGPQ
jgi:two-component system chemotaxis response regulator CheY